ncbi:MAG: type II toxin-antitoxin system YafQ family toxin [Streptococcaceae bacterium]|jgi:mRNA interferase YafQ|nr:type II toxin-antitoxin system YafQ family toxin [Streptococcaceae bacterium]
MTKNIKETKYEIIRTSKFKKQLRKIAKSGQYKRTDFEELESLILQLANGESLEEKYYDHSLKGYKTKTREFHWKPDLPIMYTVFENQLILSFDEVANHNSMF